MIHMGFVDKTRKKNAHLVVYHHLPAKKMPLEGRHVIFFFATVLGDLPALQDLNQVSHLGVGSVLFDQVAASDGPGGCTRGSAG